MSNKMALDALTKFVKNAEQSVFEDWLEAKSPSGDVEQVQRQWEASSEYREFCEKLGNPSIAAIAALQAEDPQPEHERNAARYIKLRGWMSSNVEEGWREVEHLGALAAWESWDAFEMHLDSLPPCNVGLMAKALSATPPKD